MQAWPKNIFAITLIVADLQVAKRFYQDAFGLPLVREDHLSITLDFHSIVVNLASVEEAPALLGPAADPAGRAGHPQLEITIIVEDVDALCRDLTARGVELLTEPVDREWGLRTASFQDPDGYVWEIAQNLPGGPVEPDHLSRLLAPA